MGVKREKESLGGKPQPGCTKAQLPQSSWLRFPFSLGQSPQPRGGIGVVFSKWICRFCISQWVKLTHCEMELTREVIFL